MENVLAVFGGLVAVGQALYWTGQAVAHRRRRSILQFGPRRPVQIVVATTYAAVQFGPRKIPLPASGWGQIVGVRHALPVLVRHYPKKEPALHLSDASGVDLRDDVIMFGSPITNAVTRSFLERLNEAGNAIEFDPRLRLIRVPGRDVEDFPWEEQIHGEGVPKKDMCLIVVAPSPWSSKRRAVLCCGLSTYGTAAAAAFLFRTVVPAKKDFWEDCGFSPRAPGGFGLLFAVNLNATGSPVGEEKPHAFLLRSKPSHGVNLQAP